MCGCDFRKGQVADSTSKLDSDDLTPMAVYLKSLPGRGEKREPIKADDPVMIAGQAIYRDQCSACHALDGKGSPQLFPALADSSVARSRDPATLLRLVLRGGRSVATNAEPTGPGMPSFAWQLNDQQVAAVATYVRNTWGGAAPALTSSAVQDAREKLKTRKD